MPQEAPFRSAQWWLWRSGSSLVAAAFHAVLLTPGRPVRECVRRRAFPPLALHIENKKKKIRFAKPIMSVPTSLPSTRRTRLALSPTCTGSTCP
jgi:hypothetical protein